MAARPTNRETKLFHQKLLKKININASQFYKMLRTVFQSSHTSVTPIIVSEILLDWHPCQLSMFLSYVFLPFCVYWYNVWFNVISWRCKKPRNLFKITVHLDINVCKLFLVIFFCLFFDCCLLSSYRFVGVASNIRGPVHCFTQALQISSLTVSSVWFPCWCLWGQMFIALLYSNVSILTLSSWLWAHLKKYLFLKKLGR